VRKESEAESRVLAIKLKESELLCRERGLDSIEVREKALRLQGEKATKLSKETDRRIEDAQTEVVEWKRKCQKKEEERSGLEAMHVKRMERDGYVVLSSGSRLCRGEGGGLGEHTRVVEGALEDKVTELKAERDRFVKEKADCERERDEWASEKIEAGIRSRELGLCANCLEQGMSVQHSKAKEGVKSVEAEKRKAARAVERGRHTREQLARTELALAHGKHRRRVEQQKERRATLKQPNDLELL
jgi:hypothetical protein